MSPIAGGHRGLQSTKASYQQRMQWSFVVVNSINIPNKTTNEQMSFAK